MALMEFQGIIEKPQGCLRAAALFLSGILFFSPLHLYHNAWYPKSS